MTLASLAARNLLRNRVRTALTITGVAVAVLVFILVRTVLGAWSAASEHAAKDRLATRNQVAFVLPLPKRYVETVRATRGVERVTWVTMFGGKIAGHEKELFASYAVDAASFLDVFDDVGVTAAEKTRWIGERDGALVGDLLAKKLGWKVGDTILIVNPAHRGEWRFRISGIYTAQKKSVPRSRVFFHWELLNDQADARRKDQVGMIFARIGDPARSADVSAAIDRGFALEGVRTVTMSERAMNLSAMSMVSGVLRALDVVSLAILGIMLLLLGNTIAMGVRERTNEYGVLRAIGFSPGSVRGLILGESIFLGLVGGAAGVLIAIPIVERGLGRWLEENVGAFFPSFQISGTVMLAAVALAALLGAVAGLLPAIAAGRLEVVEALRRVD